MTMRPGMLGLAPASRSDSTTVGALTMADRKRAVLRCRARSAGAVPSGPRSAHHGSSAPPPAARVDPEWCWPPGPHQGSGHLGHKHIFPDSQRNPRKGWLEHAGWSRDLLIPPAMGPAPGCKQRPGTRQLHCRIRFPHRTRPRWRTLVADPHQHNQALWKAPRDDLPIAYGLPMISFVPGGSK